MIALRWVDDLKGDDSAYEPLAPRVLGVSEADWSQILGRSLFSQRLKRLL